MSNTCQSCVEWRKMGLSDTCPACDYDQRNTPPTMSVALNQKHLIAILYEKIGKADAAIVELRESLEFHKKLAEKRYADMCAAQAEVERLRIEGKSLHTEVVVWSEQADKLAEVVEDYLRYIGYEYGNATKEYGRIHDVLKDYRADQKRGE